MVDNIYKMLNNCIENHLNAMAGYDVGSNEMQQAISDVAGLYKLRIEDERNELDKERMCTDRDDKTGHAELEEKKLALERERASADSLVQNRHAELEDKRFELERKRSVMENNIQNRRYKLDMGKLRLDTIIGAAEVVLPLALYGWLSYIGFAREFDGVVSSDTLKRVLNSIKAKR